MERTCVNFFRFLWTLLVLMIFPSESLVPISHPVAPHIPRSPVPLSRSPPPPPLTCLRRRHHPCPDRLLPYEHARRSGVWDHEDRVTELPSAPRSSTSSSRYHSSYNTPTPLSSCSGTRSVPVGNKKNAKLLPLLPGGWRSSSWKILLHYLWFLCRCTGRWGPCGRSRHHALSRISFLLPPDYHMLSHM
jgi:hypothetical protein